MYLYPSLQTQVCETSDMATSNRRLGITRKLVVLQDEASAAEMDYTMYVIVLCYDLHTSPYILTLISFLVFDIAHNLTHI